MLNIFAEALFLATRIGTGRETSARRSPREFQDIESLRTIDTLRQPLR
ncbi:MAG: hypothetical protein JNN02_02980 [Tabrizicola sp.]|nr:hypothetical protein [Tabrizicola sp.]